MRVGFLARPALFATERIVHEPPVTPAIDRWSALAA
jgi:hypothetical protein